MLSFAFSVVLLTFAALWWRQGGNGSRFCFQDKCILHASCRRVSQLLNARQLNHAFRSPMEIPPCSKHLLCQSSSKHRPVMHERSCCIDVISSFTGHGKVGLHDIVFAWTMEDKTVMIDRLRELLVRTALRAATPRLHLSILAAASYPSSQTSAAHGICLEAFRISDPVAYFMP